MSFRKSIFLLLGVSMLVSIVIGGIGSYFTIRNANTIAFQHENTTKAIMYMSEVKANVSKMQMLLLQIALDKSATPRNVAHDQVLALYQKNAELLRMYRETIPSGPKEQVLYALFEYKREHARAVIKDSLDLALAAKTDEAINAFNLFYGEKVLPLFTEISDTLDALNLDMSEAAARANVLNYKNSNMVLVLIASIIAISIIALLAVGQYFSTNILHAVERVTGLASSIAKNDFSKEMDSDLLARKDEFGTMARGLNLMRGNLAAMIDQLNKHAEVLSASNELAQKASKSKSFFLARMSHEIRTPLNAIMGMSHIAKNTEDSAKIHDSLNKITASATHLLGIINDILDMTKIESGKFELVNEEFSLEKLLMNVCEVISAKTEKREQQLEVTVKNGLPSRFVGDNLRLSQVLLNILNNASKFTPQKGSVSLTASCLLRDDLKSTVQFCVEDTGIGLTREQIKHLFIPFEQVDGGTARQFGGAGLGLAICDTIVRLMDGNIRMESEPGKGSRFIVTLNLQNAPQSDTAQLDASIDAQAVKVLLLAPAQATRDFFTSLFAELKIFITPSETFDAAFAQLKNNAEGEPFNIIFVDWNAVRAEGFERLQEMKEASGDRAVVALSSPAELIEVEAKAMTAGVSKVLPKPVFPYAVINLINEIIGAQAGDAGPDSIEGPDLQGKKILVVEDIEINREIVAAFLEDTGAQIDFAETGVEAVEKYIAADGRYDLIFMDINMPIMDGHTATRRIREHEKKHSWERAPVIAMTANAFKEDKENSLEAGMDTHLVKPLDFSEFMQTCKTYLK